MTRKRKIRRNLIIDVAEQSFIENGFDDANVDLIALDAGYTKATIYNYFDSKEDLFTGVVARIYEQMFETFMTFLEESETSHDLRTIGDAYLTFVERFPGQAAIVDSGRCVTINRTIIEKEERGQALTESEREFVENETEVGMLVTGLISTTLKESGITSKVDPLRITKILSAFMPVIRELVRRGNVGGQSNEEIRETLSVLFTIIEQGVKNYNE
jgi:AcrR family transcriptional regulator